ncbi:hypothetical protein D6C97_02444 [Aureobasidium pullulans]|nr:hypothetical protein D6C97_02444 [Aureobasidium pullulans]
MALPTREDNSNVSLSDPNYGPIPGESRTYVDYGQTAAPFPGNITGAAIPTETGHPGPDDLLFQNLLSAISATSVKPGPCTYDYGFNNASTWLALQVVLELSSMAFLTGLVREAELKDTMSALVAIAEVESRHNTWALIDIFNTNPFSGPADTVFPYANEILDLTNRYMVPGSCPAANPVYPSPRQELPATTAVVEKAKGIVEFEFTDAGNQPDWYWQQKDRQYYAVYFHGVHNMTMPFDTKTNQSAHPTMFDAGEGMIVAVIANEVGAPSLNSVVAGPALIIEQPSFS